MLTGKGAIIGLYSAMWISLSPDDDFINWKGGDHGLRRMDQELRNDPGLHTYSPCLWFPHPERIRQKAPQQRHHAAANGEPDGRQPVITLQSAAKAQSVLRKGSILE